MKHNDPQMIDLRSDTVTTPCDAMRRAMANAKVGDDVYDEDPTVKHLEQKLSELAGQEAGLFFPSGTQSNLVALLSHCQRGDEYIAAENAHTYRYEAGGAAVLGGIQPQPLASEADGSLAIDKIAAAIKADDFHFPRTRLLVLENTTDGKVLSLDYLKRAELLVREHGLGFHLDGARVFNAAVELGVEVSQITQRFDSVSICLSKGLGAPIGSVLCANREFIKRARRGRKITGGGMRQVGILAAAGIYALDNNIERLRYDHIQAKQLACGLQEIAGLQVLDGRAQTNMVFVSLPLSADEFVTLQAHAKANNLLLGERLHNGMLRLVVHKHLTQDSISKAIEILTKFFVG